jgi:hypothetical protein
MTDTDSILAARQTTHGDFRDHAQITQDIKHVMHASRNWIHLPATHRETFEMIAHKIGRALAGDFNFPDHYTDIQGYARLVERICEDGAAQKKAGDDLEDGVVELARKLAPRAKTETEPTPLKQRLESLGAAHPPYPAGFGANPSGKAR